MYDCFQSICSSSCRKIGDPFTAYKFTEIMWVYLHSEKLVILLSQWWETKYNCWQISCTNFPSSKTSCSHPAQQASALALFSFSLLSRSKWLSTLFSANVKQFNDVLSLPDEFPPPVGFLRAYLLFAGSLWVCSISNFSTAETWKEFGTVDQPRKGCSHPA